MYLLDLKEAEAIALDGFVNPIILKEMVGTSTTHAYSFISQFVDGTKNRIQELKIRGRPPEQIFDVWIVNRCVLEAIAKTLKWENYANGFQNHAFDGICALSGLEHQLKNVSRDHRYTRSHEYRKCDCERCINLLYNNYLSKYKSDKTNTRGKK